MRNIPRVSFIAVATALLLAGCTPTDPIVKPEPAPSSTPIFASEEDALAAATAAYAAYVKVSDQITSDGGSDGDRIAPYVTEGQLARDLEVFEYYKSKGYFSRGQTKFDSVGLQSYVPDGPDGPELAIYLCTDYSAIRLVDSTGSDVTPSDLPTRAPMEVTLQEADDSKSLVVERSESWSGTDFCS